MILNSGRHTQPDPQSCRVRSLGGRRGSPKTNNASRDQNKTERCKRKHRKSIPPAMSQQNQHLTHAMLRKPATTTPKQFQTTWCFRKDWQHADGARDLQSATVIFGAVNTLAFGLQEVVLSSMSQDQISSWMEASTPRHGCHSLRRSGNLKLLVFRQPWTGG